MDMLRDFSLERGHLVRMRLAHIKIAPDRGCSDRTLSRMEHRGSARPQRHQMLPTVAIAVISQHAKSDFMANRRQAQAAVRGTRAHLRAARATAVRPIRSIALPFPPSIVIQLRAAAFSASPAPRRARQPITDARNATLTTRSARCRQKSRVS